jgi:hypothetical protein
VFHFFAFSPISPILNIFQVRILKITLDDSADFFGAGYDGPPPRATGAAGLTHSWR